MPNPRPALQAVLQMLRGTRGEVFQVPVEKGASSMLESLKRLLAAGGGKKLFQPQAAESPEASRRLLLNFLRKTGRGEGAEYIEATGKKRAWEATLDLASEKPVNPRLEEVRKMMTQLREMGPEPTTAFRGADLRKRLQGMGEEFGRPLTRPTREQARFSAMETRKRLYETANLDPEVFQHDYQTGVQGLTGRALTAKQLQEIKRAITPEFAAKIKDVKFPDVGPISLARLENLLGKRTRSMQPFFARGMKQDVTLRAGRRQRVETARELFTGGPTFDPTAGPRAGGAGIFRKAQQLGGSLELREASARQTAALMRSFGDESRSVDELTKMILGSMEAGSRTGGLEQTQAGRRMLQAVTTMRGEAGGLFPKGPGQVSGALDQLLGPLRDISSAERGPRKEALAKLKQKVLDMMGETYTGGAT
ncbi:hypothetical protein LCGC14_1002050 [marine sediment metagenome]|uniref:Uncharacterized protein n=1 Tax=marine sediment metagenome TaxID=412755 RepID=A0A0F9JCS1_9ZZZZ